ncbi:hypothetical protein D3C85_1062670 [compost metagenome]
MAATAPLVVALDKACMNAHQIGICALLPFRALNEVSQPVEEGDGSRNWHCCARLWSNWRVLRLTLTTGIPQSATTT